jgi:hypothetical protein
MMVKRGVLYAIVPLAGVILLVGSFLTRRGPAAGDPPRKAAAAKPAAPRAVQAPVGVPVALPKPASPEAVSRAVDEGRLRSTYQNYRSAVATGNEVLAKALQPVLLREREAALRLAEEEMSRAGTPLDRDIAQKTLEALRR